MKAALVLVALLGISACAQSRIPDNDDEESEWESFKLNYNKIYNDESEDRLRMMVFQDNKKIIDNHNERWMSGEESYEMGVDQFTDMLPEEINQAFDGNYDDEQLENLEANLQNGEDNNFQLPREVNWTKMGAVTPVGSQGHFNNSWAFAAAGVIESRWFLKGHKMVILSKQDLVDCCHKKTHHLTANALLCVKHRKGIDTETSYPYRGAIGKCHYSRWHSVAKIKTVFQLKWGNETLLANAVATGPVTAVIPFFAIRNYKSGIFQHAKCGQSPDFAVLIVGYGNCPKHGDYWLLKTPMGTHWGEKGYMRLARNKNNHCGITNRVYYPTF